MVFLLVASNYAQYTCSSHVLGPWYCQAQSQPTEAMLSEALFPDSLTKATWLWKFFFLKFTQDPRLEKKPTGDRTMATQKPSQRTTTQLSDTPLQSPRTLFQKVCRFPQWVIQKNQHNIFDEKTH